jgi:hypothetical protein
MTSRQTVTPLLFFPAFVIQYFAFLETVGKDLTGISGVTVIRNTKREGIILFVIFLVCIVTYRYLFFRPDKIESQRGCHRQGAYSDVPG